MIPITAAGSGKLTWCRVSFRGEYQLQLNEQLAGTLKSPSFWSSRRVATTENGQWEFRRTGFSGSGGEITDCTSGQVVATYEAGWWGRGSLSFSDGQKFDVKMEGVFRPVWSFISEGGQTVVRIHSRGKKVELLEGVTVPPARLGVLIMFGLNCILLSEENAASAALVAGTS